MTGGRSTDWDILCGEDSHLSGEIIDVPILSSLDELVLDQQWEVLGGFETRHFEKEYML